MEEVVVYQPGNFKCQLEHSPTSFLHLHNEIEMLYLRKGKVALRHGLETYELAEGDFAFILPNVVHAINVVGEAEYLSCRADKNLFMGLVTWFWGNAIDGSPTVSLDKMHPEVAFCIAQLCERKELWGENVITKSYLTIILRNLLDNLTMVPLAQEARVEWLGEALAYLNNHFKQPVTLDEMAKELGVSKYHLSRNFNARVGCSITDYLNGLRVGKAQRMLDRFDDSVLTLAYECGFESPTTFFRAFKEYTGMSPKKYQSMVKAKHFKAISTQKKADTAQK